MKTYGKTAGHREEIRQARQAGDSLSLIAQRFGINRSSVLAVTQDNWNWGRRKAAKMGAGGSGEKIEAGHVQGVSGEANTTS